MQGKHFHRAKEEKTRHREQYISPTQFTFYNPLAKGIQHRI